jgi:uncharacterized protein (TIGR02588 family)
MKGRAGKRASMRRKTAEWITTAGSVLVVVAVAAFLLYEIVGPDSPYVPVSIRPRLDQVERRDERWLLPVEVENRGRRTLQGFKAEVTYEAPAGDRGRREIEIDFLGEGSVQRHYVSLDRDPRQLRIEARPLSYHVD